MMPVGGHCLPKHICEPKGQTTNFPITNSNTVVWQSVHIDADIVQGHLANYSSNNV